MKFELVCGSLQPVDDDAVAWLFNAKERDTLELKPGTKRRSIGQNSLYQKWARQFAAHEFGVEEDAVTDTQHEAMKISLQRHCYADTGWSFLICTYPDAFGGKSKPQRAPTSKMEPGEIHMLLNWVQMFAAGRGLTLESLGEYKELQERQVA